MIDRVLVFGEHENAIERIAPGFFPASFEAEHMARYRWASRWASGKTLDVACGTGYGAKLLQGRRSVSVISVDISAEAIEFGKMRYGLLALQADAHRLPLSTGSVDAVVSLETIEHLSRPKMFLDEVFRILRSGGVLMLSTPNKLLSSGTNPYHLREFEIHELTGLLESSGFHILRLFGQHWCLRHEMWNKVRGMRRLAYELQRRSWIMPWPIPLVAPRYFCIQAAKPVDR